VRLPVSGATLLVVRHPVAFTTEVAAEQTLISLPAASISSAGCLVRRAMQYYKLPQPRWTAGKGPTIAVTQVNGNILVTHATDLQRTPPSIDLNNPEADDSVEDKDPDIEVVVSIFDAAAGRMENRPALVCKDGAEAGQCFVIDGTLYVNCGDRLVAWQNEQSSWTTVVEKVEHRIQSPVVAMDGCIHVLWCGPSNTENQEYQFSKTAQGRTVWGPRFGPTDGHRAEWQVFMGDLYVRCQIGGVSPDVPVPTMFRVNADSLTVEAEAAPGIRGKMLIADRQLFCDGEIDFGEVAKLARNSLFLSEMPQSKSPQVDHLRM
jgi:hypothetical protein